MLGGDSGGGGVMAAGEIRTFPIARGQAPGGAHPVMEQALLGALLVNNAALDRDDIAQLLPEHFTIDLHGRIFDTIRGLVARGQVADPNVLRSFFEEDAAAIEAGGAAYIGRLAAAAATIINAEQYARSIRDAAYRRRLIQAGHTIIAEASTPDVDRPIDDVVASCDAALNDASDGVTVDERLAHIRHASRQSLERVEAAMRADGAPTGITTGLRSIDDHIGGLHPSELTVLAARPAMGKTSAACTTILAVARAGVPVLFFSLEMSADQIAGRLHAQLTGISVESMRTGRIGAIDMQMLIGASEAVSALPIVTDDTPAITLAHLRSKARKTKRRIGLGLIVVDYIQLMRSAGRVENRTQEVSQISAGLKAIAKEFAVPVLALSQLSREVEKRDQKRPVLSDLRDSGSIEQDADAVMFLYRHEYYLAQEEPKQASVKEEQIQYLERRNRWATLMEDAKGKAEVHLAKQRFGPARTINVRFDGERSAFYDIADQER